MWFVSQKRLLLLIVLILFSFLGCVGMQGVPIQEGSSSFQNGYKDGANSGFVVAGNSQNKWEKDDKLFSSDMDYKRGWEEGFFKGLGKQKTSAKTDRAISLINSEDKVLEALVVSFFSLKPHKAFALNPSDQQNYYLGYKYNSKPSAKSDTLKKCGTLCTLFAEDDNIVWEKNLDEWEKTYIEDRSNSTKHLDEHHNTIFHYLMRGKKFKYANYLLKNGADINIGNKYNSTALLIAAENGNFDSVKFLIDYGADINKPNIYNATPLLFAASKGYTDIVKLLIENGADLNIKTRDGNSPLGIAKIKGHWEIIRLLKTQLSKE